VRYSVGAGLIALLRVAVTIALVGDQNDAYPSHRELNAARVMLGPDVVIEATADDAEAEVIELPAKRFFMLTLFQPQIGALAGKPLHPLLREFVRCARQRAAQA
jgi:hypothetical protein